MSWVKPETHKDRLISMIAICGEMPVDQLVYNNRDHRKLAIIDGYVGYTGGVNIADEYANIKERFGHWKDSGIRLYGQAVQSMTLMFLKTWDIYSNSKTRYQDFIPQNYDEEIFKSDGFVQPYGDGPYPVYEHAVCNNNANTMAGNSTRFIILLFFKWLYFVF